MSELQTGGLQLGFHMFIVYPDAPRLGLLKRILYDCTPQGISHVFWIFVRTWVAEGWLFKSEDLNHG